MNRTAIPKILLLIAVPPVLLAEEPARALPPLPGPCAELAASSDGYLYAHVRGGGLLVWHLAKEGGAWGKVPLEDVSELCRNVSGEVFARRKDGGTAAYYRLQGEEAVELVSQRTFERGEWYVDAVGRVWFQKEKDDLIILQKGKEPQVIKSQPSKYGREIRRPCEWKPGHVFLFHNTSVVLAGPEEIQVRRPARFAEGGTPDGPIRLGDHFLLSGGSNNRGMGSYVLDTRDLSAPPRRLRLGWDWFHDVASAPDGRALVKAQTDRDPRFTLFWYAPDGKSQVQLKGADDVIRVGMTRPVFFNTRNVGYMRLKDGTLAAFGPDTARVITPASGLPVSKVAHLAIYKDQLALAGAEGKVALWNTRVPLRQVTAAEFDLRGEWRLAGPCSLDADGNLWAFLLDFPGQISRFDGEHWTHRKLELGRRQPRTLTADDLGNLQLSFHDHPSGSVLIGKEGIESWREAPQKAWTESVRRGAKRFFDGSPYRTVHWTIGDGRVWYYDGQTLLDGVLGTAYHDRPFGRFWWVDPDGTWFRHSKELMAFRRGRWRHVPILPRRLLLGPNGLQSFDGRTLEERPDDYLPVIWQGSFSLSARGSGRVPKGRRGRALYLDRVRLEGNEIYLRTRLGGGWAGNKRYFRGAFFWSGIPRKFIEAPQARFLIEGGREGTLRLHRPRDLKVRAELREAGPDWTVAWKAEADPPPERPRILVTIEGAPELVAAEELRLPKEKYAGKALELWAVDEYGDVSQTPAKLRLPGDGASEDDRGAGPSPQRDRWKIVPRTVSADGEKYELLASLEFDAEGTALLTARKGERAPTEVLAYEPRRDRWSLVPADGNHFRWLSRSPDGRVWGIQAPHGQTMGWKLFAVGRNAVRFATTVYSDGIQEPSWAWDSENRFWTLGQRWVGCWDGIEWREWERPIGGATVLAHPGGRATILARDRVLTFDGRELSEPRSLPDGWRPRIPGYALGKHHVVVRCEQKMGRSTKSVWCLYDLRDGSLDAERFPYSYSSQFCSDGRGNLVAWDTRKKTLQRLSGDDLGVEELTYTDPPPSDWRNQHFLVTSSGMMVYPDREGNIVTWARGKGAEKHGWRDGIQQANTGFIREGPDGRVWILTSEQLIIHDPEADPAKTSPFEGWQEIRAAGTACPGFGQTVWYWQPDKTTVSATDGRGTKSWDVKERPGNRTPRIEVVSDRGEALVFSSAGAYAHLRADGSVRRLSNAEEGLLEMVKSGARKFISSGYPPVVAADGRVYFKGRVWDGRRWVPTQNGRAFLDLRGDLLIITNVERRQPFVHRLVGSKAEPIGVSGRYLIDEIGVRWFDPGIVEDEPNRFPVCIADDRGHKIALNPTREGHPIYNPVRAVPLGEERFLVLTRYGDLYHLSRQGLERLDFKNVPFGRKRGALHRLADGRWAWLFRDHLFVSPPHFPLCGPTDDTSEGNR